jgi:phage gpG-like protein
VIQYYFAREVTIPARPFLGINDAMIERFEEMAAEYSAQWVEKQIQQGLGGT